MHRLARTGVVTTAVLACGAWLPLPAQASRPAGAGKAQPSAAQAPDACSLLTRDEIRKLTGRSDAVRFPPTLDELSAGGSSCTMDGGGGSANRGIQIYVAPGETRKSFNATRKGGETVRDIGDEAYYVQQKNGGAIFVLVGQYRLHVGIDSETEPPEAYRPAVLALAKAAAAKLR